MNYIQILGLDHFIYLSVLAVFGILLFYFQSFIENNRLQLTKIIFCISLAQQFILYGSYILLGEFSLAESLPLHISRINTILGLIFLATRSQQSFNFITYFSVFAWLSFLLPSKVEPITHIRGISFLINHVITLLLPFYGLIAYKMTLQRKYRDKVIIYFLLYFMIVAIVNPLIDGNYFYLKDKPVLSSLPNTVYYPLAILASLILFFLIEGIFMTIQRYILKWSY